MITEEKIKEIKKQIRNGIPEGEIKNEMMSQGFSDDDIKKVFAPHKYDMRSWYLTFAMIFLLLGMYKLVQQSSILFLLFSAGIFYAYRLEFLRKEKEKSNE